MSLLKWPPGLFLPRLLVLLMCCRVAADRNLEKKQAMKARDRAVRDALHLAEDLEDKREASAASRDNLEMMHRQSQHNSDATWRHILPKLLAPVSDEGLGGEGFTADRHRHRRDDAAQQDLLARLAASVSASGDPQAMRDLRHLMQDMRAFEDADSNVKVQERPSSDPLLTAEMESKALKEESVRELELLRHGDAAADQAPIPEGDGLAPTSAEEAAAGTVPLSPDTPASSGTARFLRRRPRNRLLQLASGRRAKAAAARARRRALETARLLEGDDIGSTEPGPEPSMPTGLADVTRRHRLTNDLAANVRAAQDDAYSTHAGSSTSAQDLRDSLDDGNTDSLLSNMAEDGGNFGSQVQLSREEKTECRSPYECHKKFVDRCTAGTPCICSDAGKCEKTDACGPEKGCGENRVCVQHEKVYLCEDRVADAYEEADRKKDAENLEAEIKNMQEQRNILQSEAKDAFSKMKDYHSAIPQLTEPMRKMREEAKVAQENYERQIMEHEDDRVKNLNSWDASDGIEEESADSLLDDLDFIDFRLKQLNSGDGSPTG